MSTDNSPKYIEILKENTVESIRKSLEHSKEDRVENAYLNSEIPVIERLLHRFDELTLLWEKLISEFNYKARYDFIDCILGLIITANPNSFVEARGLMKELEKENKEIAKTASHLSKLMKSHSEKKEGKGISSDNYYSIRDAINHAAELDSIHLYEVYPKTKLNHFFNQYEQRYWPTLSQLVNAIAVNAEQSEIYPTDETTYVGTQSQRASSVDCIKAFYKVLGNANHNDINMKGKVMSLPNGVIASLLNIVYDWEGDNTLTTEQLKNYKSRINRKK